MTLYLNLIGVLVHIFKCWENVTSDYTHVILFSIRTVYLHVKRSTVKHSLDRDKRTHAVMPRISLEYVTKFITRFRYGR